MEPKKHFIHVSKSNDNRHHREVQKFVVDDGDKFLTQRVVISVTRHRSGPYWRAFSNEYVEETFDVIKFDFLHKPSIKITIGEGAAMETQTFQTIGRKNNICLLDKNGFVFQDSVPDCFGTIHLNSNVTRNDEHEQREYKLCIEFFE